MFWTKVNVDEISWLGCLLRRGASSLDKAAGEIACEIFVLDKSWNPHKEDISKTLYLWLFARLPFFRWRSWSGWHFYFFTRHVGNMTKLMCFPLFEWIVQKRWRSRSFSKRKGTLHFFSAFSVFVFSSRPAHRRRPGQRIKTENNTRVKYI